MRARVNNAPMRYSCQDLLLAFRLAPLAYGAPRGNLLLVAIKMDKQREDEAAKIELGRQIKIARKKAGLTQAALGVLVGLQQAEISAIESGTRGLTFYAYQRLAAGIGCSLDAFRISEGRLVSRIAALHSDDPQGNHHHSN